MLRKITIGVGISILIVGLMFLGGCRHNTPERMADKVVGDLTAKLELNASQQQELEVIKTEFLGKMSEMKKNRETTHDALLTELQKDVLNQDNLKKMVNTHKAEMDEIANIAIARLAKFHSTLSSEQKKKLVEYVKDKEKSHRRCPFSR